VLGSMGVVQEYDKVQQVELPQVVAVPGKRLREGEELEVAHVKKRKKSRRQSGNNGDGGKRYSSGLMRCKAASDSDEMTAPTFSGSIASMSAIDRDMTTCHGFSVLSNRPSKFNFFVELDDQYDGSQRIAIIQERLTELRKTYMALKAEVACIDRRRKKLRRKEKAFSAVSCSAAEVEYF